MGDPTQLQKDWEQLTKEVRAAGFHKGARAMTAAEKILLDALAGSQPLNNILEQVGDLAVMNFPDDQKQAVKQLWKVLFAQDLIGFLALAETE